MAEARPTPTSRSQPSSSVAPAPAADAAVLRSLPTTLFLPRSSNRSRGGSAGAAGSRKSKTPVGSATGAEGTSNRHERLVKAERLVGRGVDPAVAGADILELAMAKGPMFLWLSYWPEEGYPKEDQPY